MGHPQISAEVQGQETRDLAAEKSGLGVWNSANIGGIPGPGNTRPDGKVQISAQFHEEKTRDLAAEKSGLGGHATYSKAEKELMHPVSVIKEHKSIKDCKDS